MVASVYSAGTCLHISTSPAAETKVTSVLAGIINAVTPLMTLLALVGAVSCYGVALPYSRKFILPFYLFHGIEKDHYRLGPIVAMLALGILGTGYAYIWNFQIMAAAGSAIASSVTYVTRG